MKRRIRRSKDVDDFMVIKLLDLVDNISMKPSDEELFIALNKAYQLGAKNKEKEK